MSYELAMQVGALLREKQQQLATAESCTGGLISHWITEVSGSSAYFMGGIASYSNEAKMQLLGVQEQTLINNGAVSEPTAREMVLGAQKRFSVDYALSVTGIAGPGGGTDEKPVGLTYIGLATPHDVKVHQFIWKGNRSQNKQSSASAALQLLLDYLKTA